MALHPHFQDMAQYPAFSEGPLSTAEHLDSLIRLLQAIDEIILYPVTRSLHRPWVIEFSLILHSSLAKGRVCLTMKHVRDSSLL